MNRLQIRLFGPSSAHITAGGYKFEVQQEVKKAWFLRQQF